MDKDFFDVPEGLWRSEEHTSELQSQSNLVCRLLLEKKKSRYELPIPPQKVAASAHLPLSRRVALVLPDMPGSVDAQVQRPNPHGPRPTTPAARCYASCERRLALPSSCGCIASISDVDADLSVASP